MSDMFIASKSAVFFFETTRNSSFTRLTCHHPGSPGIGSYAQCGRGALGLQEDLNGKD